MYKQANDATNVRLGVILNVIAAAVAEDAIKRAVKKKKKSRANRSSKWNGFMKR